MRICLLAHQGNPYAGGQGVYVRFLSRELARLGHAVHVVAGPPYPEVGAGVTLHRLPSYDWVVAVDWGGATFWGRPAASYLEPLNWAELAASRCGFYPSLTTFSLRALPAVLALHARHPFDVVHDNQSLGYGSLLLKRSGLPVVATVHHPLSVDRAGALARSPWEQARELLHFPLWMQGQVARRLDRVVTVSEASARAVRAAYGVASERIRVVYNGVDAETFRPLPGVTRQPQHLLFVGRSEDPNKGARFLLEALALLRDEVPFHLTLVDRKREELRLAPALVRRHGLSTRVTFTGRVSTAELVALYNRAGLVVSPSVYEGFGLPAAEAMACGAPLVATTGGAFPEIVEHNRTGWLVPPADPAALAAAIRLLLGDAGLRARLGAAAAARIRERFDWRRAARQTEAVYQEALEGRGRG